MTDHTARAQKFCLEARIAWVICIGFAVIEVFSGDAQTAKVFAAAAIVIGACGRRS